MDGAPIDGQLKDIDTEHLKAGQGETMLQLILASIIAVGAGLWAWSLVATAFAGPPSVSPPGIIGVAAEASAGTESAPIDVTAIYAPATDGKAATVSLVFTQIVSAAASKHPSPPIIVFLCGPIAQHPDFQDGYFKPVAWRVPSSPEPGVWSSVFGSLGQCVDTTLSMENPGSGQFRQALISGSFGVTASNVSGTKTLYALPGITNWFLPVPLDGLKPAAMPPGSTLSVSLNKDLGDLTNVFADPQLPDAGTLKWSGELNAPTQPIREYRLEADSQTAISQLQFHLFLAGALVGISGGAFVWLVQLCGQTGYKAIVERGKRKKPEAREEQANVPIDPVTQEPATPLPTQPVVAGLGWPT
jgi:hypothetical protein